MKNASRIRSIVDRLTSPDDLAELARMAQAEVAYGVAFRDTGRFDRGAAIYAAAKERLGNVRVRGQLPQIPQAA